MAKTTKKQAEVPAVVTRAEKKDATKNLIRELLAVKPHKHNELIEETAKLYTERFGGEETENVNDVKGRVGSVLDIMKKDSDVAYENGMYALKARTMPAPIEPKAEKPVKKVTKAKTKKSDETQEEQKSEPTKKPAKKSKKAEISAVEKAEERPAEKKEQQKEETEKKTKSVKKTAKAKAKKETDLEAAAVKSENLAVEESSAKEKEQKPALIEEGENKEETFENAPEILSEKTEKTNNPLIVKEKAEVAKKNVVMDMSFLFGAKQSQQKTDEKKEKAETQSVEKTLEKAVEKTAQPTVKSEQKTDAKAEQKIDAKAEQKQEQKPTQKAEPLKKDAKPAPVKAKNLRKVENKPMTAEERLCESFLKRMRMLGGDYFEYYSVYLLERYSRRNGRRLESLRIIGGEHDGGIDGELELTDKFGFKETIYVQAKNWNPDKGDERLWVVGETLLQQFIGACACKQAKDRKQHSRGIFVTTSRFTPDAKRILETMSDKIVGYDGKDLFEAAKECEFGVIKRGNEWVLDEKLLSGVKAFFTMY